MRPAIDPQQFGPWALITGASSGIGREFARQLASARINLVLVARRAAVLMQVGAECARDHGVAYRVIAADLSEPRFIDRLATKTHDLDLGLVVSNAGTGRPTAFLAGDLAEMEMHLRLNTLAHLQIAHHFAPRLVERRRGGFLFVGALGAEPGVPYLANDAAAKAYVHSFGQALHIELQAYGIHVTVLPPGPTDTPVIKKFGLTADRLPMTPMGVEQCVAEGLRALQANRSLIIPGRLNRLMHALVPASVARTLAGKMFAKTLPPLMVTPRRVP